MTDALNRTNHYGSQPISSIRELQASLDSKQPRNDRLTAIADAGMLDAEMQIPVYLAEGKVIFRRIGHDPGDLVDGNVLNQALAYVGGGGARIDDALTGAEPTALQRVWSAAKVKAELDAKLASAALAASGGSALAGFIQAGTGAAARTVQDKLRDLVSVKDFGAVGDGTADDTAAIQAALDTGKSIRFPKGVYKVTGTLTMNTAGQGLYGDGPSSSGSQLLFDNGASDGLVIGSLAASRSAIVLRDLMFAGSSKTGGDLLRLVRCTTSRIQNCYFGTGYNGIHLSEVNNVTLSDVTVASVIGPATSYALKLSGTDGYSTDAVTVVNFRASPDDTGRVGRPIGILLDGDVATLQIHAASMVRMGRGLVVRNTVGATQNPAFIESHALEADFPELEAISIEAGESFYFVDTYAHGSTTAHGIVLADGVTNVQFHGGNVTGHFKAGITIAADEVAIAGMAVARNSVETTGTYNGIEIGAAASGVRLFGIMAGRRGGLSGLQNYGVTVASGAQRISIVGCDLSGNVTGGLSNSASAGQVAVRGCSSATDNVPAITADGTTLLAFGNAQGTAFKVGNGSGTIVNWTRAAGSATGQAPQFLAEGSDTNIDLKLTPKGTGRVVFGTHTATADVAITGYIEIKDAAGTVRKLAVIT